MTGVRGEQKNISNYYISMIYIYTTFIQGICGFTYPDTWCGNDYISAVGLVDCKLVVFIQ